MLRCDSIPKHRSCQLAENIRIEISPCSQSIINLTSDFEPIAMMAIDEHNRQIQSGSENVKKNSPETSISIVSIENCPVLCVKHFKYRGAGHAAKGLFRPTHGLRAFHSGAYLFEHGFTAAAPLALIRKSRFMVTIEEWLIMLAVPASKELDRFMVDRIRKGWPKEEKRKFLDNFARFLAGLHEYGVFHTDLKTCNVLVYDRPHKPVKFSLLDYDDVRVFRSGVSLKRRAKNLAQLFLSTPSDIDMDDRMKFLDRYLLACSKTNIDKRRLLKMVCNRIKGKSLLYVGPEGDISESWPPADELE
ncbi:MAG: lipopolysaccharide kinase InaA family protein [Syntrophaceae bacterium]|nr:lipopolysaccharide kinase InaA family protein [Syntrophaceae bacterium]